MILGIILAAIVQAAPPVLCEDTCTITRNLGGRIKDFRDQAEQVVHNKTPVIVDGLCASACTVFVDTARDQVCLTEKALLAYHRAYIPRTPLTFDIKYETPGLNQYIKEHGGLPSPSSGNFLTINFEQGKQFYKPCPT